MEDILSRYPNNLDRFSDSTGNTLLILSATQGDDKMLKLLMAKGANGNMQNNLGNTALHYAISGKFMKCIDTLVMFGVNEKIENNMG